MFLRTVRGPTTQGSCGEPSRRAGGSNVILGRAMLFCREAIVTALSDGNVWRQEKGRQLAQIMPKNLRGERLTCVVERTGAIAVRCRRRAKKLERASDWRSRTGDSIITCVGMIRKKLAAECTMRQKPSERPAAIPLAARNWERERESRRLVRERSYYRLENISSPGQNIRSALVPSSAGTRS